SLAMSDILIFSLLVLYKIVIVGVGLGFAYMGYKLFLADKTKPAGDLEARTGKYALSLRGGAPGIFFSLFGTVLICFSIFKGIEYKSSSPNDSAVSGISIILPDHPPTTQSQHK
ncbi:MAG: hypothetical protein K1Y02_26565, partial [Candidatus Hydrogenedentes bacterium]|nr:hypothetical protein [Candidatus Hydrogenedentota bacterium]